MAFVSQKNKRKKTQTNSKTLNMFIHMLLKFEIIWTRIDQFIKLGNDIIFWNTLHINYCIFRFWEKLSKAEKPVFVMKIASRSSLKISQIL